MNQEKLQPKESMNHTTANLPFALHLLEYPKDSDILFYPHWHPEFEFLFVTSGELELYIEERHYLLSANQSVFIHSSLCHSAKNVGTTSCSFFALDFSWDFLEDNPHSHFYREYLEPLLNNSVFFPEQISPSPQADAWQNKVISSLLEIASMGEKYLFAHELFLKARIYLIWEQLYEHALINDTNFNQMENNRKRFLPVLEYIRENYFQELTLAELADLAGLSKGQFCRVFKKTFHCSPFEYLLRQRIMESCNLLIETNKKIGEIAGLCGFNNISYYNKIFLKIIRCTPKQYRSFYQTQRKSILL